MCKFTHRLFVFAILCNICNEFIAEASILRSKSKQRSEDLKDLLDVLTPDTDYDLHYDQRQKGEENLRIKLDGFLVGLPAPESSVSTLLNDQFLENLSEELLLGIGKSQTSTSAPSNNIDYYGQDSISQKQSTDSTKPYAVIVEIPAPKKDIEPIQRLESKVAEERKTSSRSKSKIGQLISLLLKARKIGHLPIAENKN